MAISEMKMQMVIANYFKDECDVNTSIRQAFEKGFRIGVEKGASMTRPQEWIPCSKRLPKDWEHVLVCTTVTYTTPIFVDWYVDEMGSWANEGDSVIAWMPLPEPWKGADDVVDAL